MAIKGTVAKENVEKKIAQVFGENYLGIYDKKIYVMSEENGEKVQVAIALTCPKVPIEFGYKPATTAAGDWDFESMEATLKVPVNAPAAEITPEEKANLQSLLERLGL